MSTKYQIRFSSRAVKDLHALPEKIAAAAFERIDVVIAANPQRAGKPLREPFERSHSARSGDYRIDRNSRLIEIERIDHRSRIYRP